LHFWNGKKVFHLRLSCVGLKMADMFMYAVHEFYVLVVLFDFFVLLFFVAEKFMIGLFFMFWDVHVVVYVRGIKLPRSD
jgi:hypothetical protein